MISARTTTTPTLSALTEELEGLRQAAQQIAERFENSARIMRESGVPPTLELLVDLKAYRLSLNEFKSKLTKNAEGCGLDSAIEGSTDATSSPNDADVSFSKLQELLDARQRIVAAEETRVRLSRLTHVGEPEFAPLAESLRVAERLCELSKCPDGGTGSEEFELLEKYRSSLNSIIRLALHSNDLSDSEWTECCENVAATFGQQLATALTRGRIRGTDSNTDEPTPTSGSNSKSSTSESSTPHDPGTDLMASLVSNVKSLRELTKNAAFTSALPVDLVAIANHRSAPANDFVSELKPNVPIVAPSQTTLGQIVIAATNRAEGSSNQKEVAVSPTDRYSESVIANEDEPAKSLHLPLVAETGARAVRISNQIIRLIGDDQLPVALQLTRCLESKPEPSTWMPPVWLLRALILGRHLSYSRGQVTRQLDEELRNFRSEILNEGNADQQMAMEFLLRAAAIPAALLAGSAMANSILRTVKISPGISQLYNYCSRIGMYGHRLGGSLVEIFRPAGTIAGASELESLSAAAREWMQNAAKKAVSYSRSSPLFLHAHWTMVAGSAMRHADTTYHWCKWQQTLSLAKRLLAPICEGLEGERHWVRKEIVRLTTHLRIVRRDLTRNDGASIESDEREIELPLPEMQVMLLEAINFANRWLNLCDQAGPGGATPLPPEALELRSEILNRSNGVNLELVQLRRTSTSALVKAAIACCQASVRYIQSVFESKLSLPSVESDPHRVFNADLLRFPGLELNHQWLPDNNPTVIEDELLARLEQGELNWRQSFDFHLKAGNHIATGRLLELDVWKNATEWEAMTSLRNARILESRSILGAELDELASEFHRAVTGLGHSPAALQEFAQRLDTLRRELPHVLDFGAFRRRLDHISSGWNRWKTSHSSLIGSATNVARPPVDVHRNEAVDRATKGERRINDQPQPPKATPQNTNAGWSSDIHQSSEIVLTYEGQASPQLILPSADIYSGE